MAVLTVAHTRQCSVTTGTLASSFTAFAVIVTGSVDFGSSGKWVTPEMTGAMSPAATEFAAPGVPPTGVLAFQFWPFALEKPALMSSSDLLFGYGSAPVWNTGVSLGPPSAGESQLHPRCPQSAQ